MEPERSRMNAISVFMFFGGELEVIGYQERDRRL